MPELAAVRAAGSLLAALLTEAGAATSFSSSSSSSSTVDSNGVGVCEGLLLGVPQARVEAGEAEDAAEAAARVTRLETDVTAFLRTGSGRGSFYGPDGQVKPARLQRALDGLSGDHEVVGWFVARRGDLAAKPSLRDMAVLKSLSEHVAASSASSSSASSSSAAASASASMRKRPWGSGGGGGGKETGGGGSGLVCPLVLLVLKLDLCPREATQGVTYAVHYLPEFARPFLHPKSLLLTVRNVAHDSTLEYRAYKGGYYSSLLPPSPPASAAAAEATGGGEGEGEEGGVVVGGARIGVAMRPGLASLAATLPAPHLAECELHFDHIMERLHGLVDAIKAEETGLWAARRRHGRLRTAVANAAAAAAAAGASQSASSGAAAAGGGAAGGDGEGKEEEGEGGGVAMEAVGSE